MSLVLLSEAGNQPIVEKLKHEILPTSMGTLSSSHSDRWGGRCKQRVYECFTLCWLGSLGHRSPPRVLFTALPAHEVSLPSLERGQSSSVSPFLFQVLSLSGQPPLTVGPVKARMAALPPTDTAVFHRGCAHSSGSKSVTFCQFFFFSSLIFEPMCEVRNCMLELQLRLNIRA